MKPSGRFENLIERSRDLVEAIRKKNSDLTPLLADQYNDPSHFVYEIIQNAEDAGAGHVTFNLSEEGLTILHDGREFDFEDIEDITGFGNSKKEGELNKIGEFGVGFKSVFAITDTPKIYSGEYRIKIEDFVIPTELDAKSLDGKTKIELPFNHSNKTTRETFDLVKDRLESIDTRSLLFLKSIGKIGWSTPSEKGYYKKNQKNIEGIEGARQVSAISKSNEKENVDRYLIFSKDDSGTEGRREEVAYKLNETGEGEEKVEPVRKSELIVFFPTKKDTYLDFLLQGPYKTTPNRENIPLRNEENEKIIDESADLVSESLLRIREMGLLDVDFLTVLPTDKANEQKSEIYTSIHRSVKKSLRQEKLLPTSTGGYVSASNALLSGSEVLTELLDSEDTKFLFSKSSWLDTRITSSRTPALWEYIRNQLGIDVVGFDRFARSITADFLKRKSDRWIARLHAQLRNQKRLWDKRGQSVLRRKPIIRTESGEHRTPFDEDETPRVYLPTEETSEYPVVKPNLMEYSQARAFLKKDLGLEPPSILSELHEHILPRYEGENPDYPESDYLRDLGKMVTAYQEVGREGKKRRLIQRLKGLPFLKSVNPAAGEQAFRKPSEVYLGTDELREYFDGFEGAWFVSKELSSYFEGGITSFLTSVGVATCPRKIGLEADLSEKRKRELRGEGKTEELEQTDFEIEGLENFLEKDITKERSLTLWELISKRGGKENERYFFKGKYRWKYYEDKMNTFDAKFYDTLKEKAWVLDREGNWKKPGQLVPSQMAPGYQMDGDGAELLSEGLLKDEIENQLPEEKKRFLELKEQYGVSSDELEALLEREKTEEEAPGEDNRSSTEDSSRESLGESSGNDWNPDVSPGGASPTVSEVKPQVSRQDLGGQSSHTTSPELEPAPSTEERESLDASDQHSISSGLSEADPSEASPNEASPGEASPGEASPNKVSPNKASLNKEIGRWGEKLALEMLRRRHEGESTEVVWLNEGDGLGIGYDLVLREDDQDIEYVEVKSKTEMNPEWVGVTETQWEFARMLHDQEDDRDYCFFVVLGAGSENPKILELKNPIEQWKEGDRPAHPVNVRLI